MKKGEPLLFGIQKDKLEHYLTERGFAQVINAPQEILEQRYLTGLNRKRYITPMLAIVHATVKSGYKQWGRDRGGGYAGL
jgi:O-methyltransferase involved in polyketide biosynthesis